jgi:hypothetical protein
VAVDLSLIPIAAINCVWLGKWGVIIFCSLTIIHLIHIMIIIFSGKCYPSDLAAARNAGCIKHGILPCIIVWCWDTPRTKVCNGYTATRFLRSRFTAVTAWTSSWFGHRVSTMEPMSFRPVQSGMLGYYPFFLPLLQQTLDPWLDTYDDPENGNFYALYWLYTLFVFIPIILITCNAGWLNSVGSRIVYELDHKKLVLYVIPIEHILG